MNKEQLFIVQNDNLNMPPIRAGRKQPRAGYKTANQKIEATPDIANLEMVWYGKGGTTGSLRPAALERKRFGADDELPGRSDTRHVHTHLGISRFARLIRKISPKGSGISPHPSLDDLILIANKLVSSRLRYWHIMAINRSGKVAGRLSLIATKKLRGSLQKRDIVLDTIENIPRWRWPLDVAVLDKLQKDGYIKYHITAMKGYEYKKGFFVQKR